MQGIGEILLPLPKFGIYRVAIARRHSLFLRPVGSDGLIDNFKEFRSVIGSQNTTRFVYP